MQAVFLCATLALRHQEADTKTLAVIFVGCYTDGAVQQMLLCRWLRHLCKRMETAISLRCRIFALIIGLYMIEFELVCNNLSVAADPPPPTAG